MDRKQTEFERAAAGKPVGLFGEIFDYLKTTGKWWLLPLVLVTLILGGLVIFASSGGAPFLYTFF